MMYLTRAKRRRTSNSETSSRARKRGKRQEAPDSNAAAASTAADSDEEGKLWSCKILEEKKERGRTRYLVGWEDHERKSESWKNEWKPAALVPSGLKKEWEAKKRQQQQPESSESEDSAGPEDEDESNDIEEATGQPNTRRVRRSRVIESSDQPLEGTPSPRQDQSLIINETPDAAFEVAASSPPPAFKSVLAARDTALNPSPNIVVSQKSDFNRSDYEIGLSQAQTASPAAFSQSTPNHGQNSHNFIAPSQHSQLPITIPDSQAETELNAAQEKKTEQQTGQTQQPISALKSLVEDAPQLASSALVLETDPIEASSLLDGIKSSKRRSRKSTIQSVGLPEVDETQDSADRSQITDPEKVFKPSNSVSGSSQKTQRPRKQVRDQAQSGEAHSPLSPSVNVNQPSGAASSQQQSLPSTRSRLSNVEAADFQEAQLRDQATEHWVSALSADQAPDSSPSAQSFSERLKDQLQSTAPENNSAALDSVPNALLPPADILSFDQTPTRDPEKSTLKQVLQTETPSDMPEKRRSLRTSGVPNISHGPTSTPKTKTPKNARGGRSGVVTRKRDAEETPQKGFTQPNQPKRRGRPPKAYKLAAIRGGSFDSQTDSEAPASAIPAEEPVAEPALEIDPSGRTHLPARIPPDEADDTMDTQPVSENEDMEVDSQSADQSSTDSEHEDDSGPSLEQMEFMVPLPMAGQARDQYRKTVKFNEELIDQLTSRKWCEYPDIISQAEEFVQTMHNIVTHVDLTNDTTLSQSDVDASAVVEWDRSVSAKFKFLYHLFDVLRVQDMHLVILARPGRLLDILENFLKGSKLGYSRPDVDRKSDGFGAKGSLNVTLLSTSGEGSNAVVRPANLILSLDHVVDVRNSRIRALRQHSTRPDYLTPVVSLAVVNSVDHIERSLTPALTGAQRVRVLVNCIAKLRRDAGKTENHFPSIEESAMEVSRFVSMGGTEEQWPLPPIGTLDNNDAWDLTQGLVSMKSSQSSDSEKSAKAKAMLKSQKRRAERVHEEEGETSKKQRMSPQPELDASITRISDSVTANSSLIDKTPTHFEEMNALRNLLQASEDSLQAVVKAKDAQIRDLEAALSDVQYRFEDQTAEKRILARDLTEIRIQLALVQKQKETRDITIDKLKEENRELRTQLSDARTALEGSTIPDVAEAEKLRQQAEQAELGRRKAEKESVSQSSLNEYLRQQYTEASSRATELVQQNAELESRTKALEKTASGEISKARQLFLGEERKRSAAEIGRLKSHIVNLNLLIQRKDEELRNKKAGVGTRAGSVPRSPRVGPSSRAGSPIPDRRIGALKNLNFNQPRRQTSRPARLDEPQEPSTPNPPPTTTATPMTTPASYATPIIHEPKPKSGRPIETKPMETKTPDLRPEPRHEPRHVESKLPPEPIPPAPRPEMRQSSMNTRPFPCCFAQYNCGSAFTSKNEWKRHISTKHIQLGFWRCDMCPPSPGIDHPIYNDFNRKDLFTQHLRRMHAVNTPQNTQEQPKPIAPSVPPGGGPPVSAPNANPQGLSDEQIAEIQKRCYRQLRQPPEISSCVFCPRTFTGPNSWEERLEHVGGHLERDRKNGTACLDVNNWRPDGQLRDYLVVEGLVEYDPRGGYRIGDGKPRRPLDIEGFAGQQPTTQLTPRPNHTAENVASMAGAAGTDNDSEGSNEKRKRGRGAKRQIEAGPKEQIMELDQPPQQPQNLQLPPTSNNGLHNGPLRSPSAHQIYGTHLHSPSSQMHSPGSQMRSPGSQQPVSQQPGPQQSPAPDRRESESILRAAMPQTPQPMHQQQQGPPHQQQGPSQQQQQQQGPPSQQQSPPQQQQGPPQQQQGPPQQMQLPPSNIQPMYEFRHGTFTKFQGTSVQQFSPRPNELPPPALSTRAHGQPQLAPRPPPDPRDAILARIYANAPGLKPPGYTEQPELAPPRPPVHHSGFKAINEPQASINRAQEQMHLAPKLTPDGARQLAPKPVLTPAQEALRPIPGGVSPRLPSGGPPRPATPPPAAVSGPTAEEKRQENRGKSFHQVVMS